MRGCVRAAVAITISFLFAMGIFLSEGESKLLWGEGWGWAEPDKSFVG